MSAQDQQPNEPEPDASISAAIRDQPGAAARAGLIAPVLGITLLLILGLTVNVWLGVAVGFAATLIALPLTIWLLARRR